ncbi:MAG: AAA family ATPase [Chloroflexota bacterium]
MKPKLIIFSGLPGTGKSSIAEAVGRQLQIPVFAKDWLESALRRSGFQENTGYAGYELLTTLAERQLRLGQSAILDSVASITAVRQKWRTLVQTHDADWCVIESVCSDIPLHQARLANRQRHIPDWAELSWEEVERVRGYFVPWDEERLILDAKRPLAENIASALHYIQ